MDQIQNESSMNYGRMPANNMDGMSSTFQSLGQALGPHMSYPISPSSANAASSTASGSPLNFVTTSPIQKRKAVEGTNEQPSKRRRDNDEAGDSFDADGAAAAKHWSEEEKTRLFQWLMGPGQDEHWNSLRATKNSCLRECAVAIFDSKKSYQALKGCYERNFNIFRQIYAFEAYNAHNGLAQVSQSLCETDRLKELDHRLQQTRKAGIDVGTLNARTVDHWHRTGWYTLFYQRWHGDPATTRASNIRGSVGANTPHGREEGDEEEASAEYPEQPMNNTINRNAINDLNNMATLNRSSVPLHQPAAANNNMTFLPQTYSELQPPQVPSHVLPQQPKANPSEQTMQMQVNVTQSMMHAFIQYLQVQTQTSKMKLDIMRRKEEREDKESSLRREYEILRQERDMEEYNIKQKYEKAMQVLDHPSADSALKEAAANFLKRMWN